MWWFDEDTSRRRAFRYVNETWVASTRWRRNFGRLAADQAGPEHSGLRSAPISAFCEPELHADHSREACDRPGAHTPQRRYSNQSTAQRVRSRACCLLQRQSIYGGVGENLDCQEVPSSVFVTTREPSRQSVHRLEAQILVQSADHGELEPQRKLIRWLSAGDMESAAAADKKRWSTQSCLPRRPARQRKTTSLQMPLSHLARLGVCAAEA